MPPRLSNPKDREGAQSGLLRSNNAVGDPEAKKKNVSVPVVNHRNKISTQSNFPSLRNSMAARFHHVAGLNDLPSFSASLGGRVPSRPECARRVCSERPPTTSSRSSDVRVTRVNKHSTRWPLLLTCDEMLGTIFVLIGVLHVHVRPSDPRNPFGASPF